MLISGQPVASALSPCSWPLRAERGSSRRRDRAKARRSFATSAADVVDFTADLAGAVRVVAPHGVAKVVHAAGDAAQLGALLAAGGQLASISGATVDTVAERT